jgi:hypothetical protein
MFEVAYTNARGQSIVLTQKKPYFLTKVDGTGNLTNIINNFKAPEQDGSFFVNNTLDMRAITIEGKITQINPQTNIGKKQLYEHRRNLMRIFSPKEQGVFTFRGKQIKCLVNDFSLLADTKERLPKFFINLLCPSPYFEELTDTLKAIAEWLNAFHFILEIPEEGIEFATRGLSQTVVVENVGDVPCGVEIRFKAVGPVTNPMLENTVTGEYIRLLTTMQSGDEYRVFTQYANKRVIKADGTNAFNLIDPMSTFFQVPVGDTEFRYDLDSGELLDLEIRIVYRPLFLGV